MSFFTPIAILVLVIFFLSAALRILNEYERGVIFRLGRVISAKGPGLIILIPVVDKMVKVSLRLVAMDVDGTYTDGQLYYDSEGEVVKGFHAHDGFALEIMRMSGIVRGFITGRKDKATRARADYLGVDFMSKIGGGGHD